MCLNQVDSYLLFLLGLIIEFSPFNNMVIMNYNLNRKVSFQIT